MKKYKWVEGSRLRLDAQTVGIELEKIRKKHDGQLTREIVLEEATRPTSPLHGGFEWDNTEAARQFRLVQAGTMIRHIVVVFEDPDDDVEREVRAFVSIKKEGDEKSHFTSINVAMEDSDLRTQVFRQALNEINSWKKKYRHLTIFARLFSEIDTMNEMVSEYYETEKTNIKPMKMKK